MFQIDGAADDPVTRSIALVSLVCAIMSLSYGCVYIVRFGTMRSMYRASHWAEVSFLFPLSRSPVLCTFINILFSHPTQEARKTDTFIYWNVWVLLAMPAVWMSWSMILFIASILSFVWRTGSIDDPIPPDGMRDPLGKKEVLAPRVVITAVLGLGMVYFGLIVRTLRSYGRYPVTVGRNAGHSAVTATGDGTTESRGRANGSAIGNVNTEVGWQNRGRPSHRGNAYEHARVEGIASEGDIRGRQRERERVVEPTIPRPEHATSRWGDLPDLHQPQHSPRKAET
jgi:hypothetical protein